MSDFDAPTEVVWHGEGFGQVKFGNDKLNMAIFYTKSVLNHAKSREENRPIHDSVAYVKIQPPGERLNIVDRPVTEIDKRKWPNEWRAFLEHRVQVPDGSPVDLLFPNNPNIPDMLRGIGVFTIEQLANLSGNAMDTVGMGAQDWVNKAKAYLDQSTNGAAFQKMNRELEELRNNNQVLSQQLSQAIEQIKAMEQRFSKPQSLLNPQNIEGVDIQAERINGNHKTKELAKKPVMDNPMSIKTGDSEF